MTCNIILQSTSQRNFTLFTLLQYFFFFAFHPAITKTFFDNETQKALRARNAEERYCKPLVHFKKSFELIKLCTVGCQSRATFGREFIQKVMRTRATMENNNHSIIFLPASEEKVPFVVLRARQFYVSE